jgi:hypothetical protein
MIAVYYRTDEAIDRNPIAYTPPKEGVDKNDYACVHTFDDDPELETVFRRMNVVVGDELPVKLRIRSMMAGDVVVDENGDPWFCDLIGWQRINW